MGEMEARRGEAAPVPYTTMSASSLVPSARVTLCSSKDEMEPLTAETACTGGGEGGGGYGGRLARGRRRASGCETGGRGGVGGAPSC